MPKFATLTVTDACETIIRQIVADKNSEIEEFLIASIGRASEARGKRKLTFDMVEKCFDLWLSGHHAWKGESLTEAVEQFNTLDPVNVDYTAENLAHAGF